MSIIWSTEGRYTRRDRRFQVRPWRRGFKTYSQPFTYHRTRFMARLSAALFAALGYRVEVWDMRPGRKPGGAR